MPLLGLRVSKLEQKDHERITTLETQLETLTKSVERIETKLDLLKGIATEQIIVDGFGFSFE